MKNDKMPFKVKIEKEPPTTIFFQGSVMYKDKAYYFGAPYNDYGGNIGYAAVDEIIWEEDFPSNKWKESVEEEIIDKIIDKFIKE